MISDNGTINVNSTKLISKTHFVYRIRCRQYEIPTDKNLSYQILVESQCKFT